jgi:2-methylcitrate dehydratase PrpD
VVLTNETGLDELFQGHMPARVTLTTRSGRTYDELVVDAKGSPLKRLTSAEVDEKFRSMVTEVLGADRTGELIRTLRSVRGVDNMAKIASMLVV